MESITSKVEKVWVEVDDICVDCDDGGGSTRKEKAMKTGEIKVLDKDDWAGGSAGAVGGKGDCSGLGGGDGGGTIVGGGNGWSLQNPAPKWSEGLHRACTPPPFLRKTFEMVGDPETDELISWSVTRKSFVIWDHHKFSCNLLPRYFRHSNFSTFVCQLNVYGFKKIHSDRWEYANQWFQAEKQHLLMNIKRRIPYSQTMQRKEETRSWLADSARHKSMVEELEKVKNDQNMLKMEISKMKQRQESLDHRLELAATKGCKGISTNSKQQEIFTFMAKAFENPELLQEFVQHLSKEREVRNGEIVKKPRLDMPQSTKSFEGEEAVDSTVNGSNQSQEELKMQRVVTPESTESSVQVVDSTNENHHEELAVDEGGNPLQHQKTTATPQTTNPAMHSENCILLEKLLEDDLDGENDAGEDLAQRQSNILIELEDLIPKPPDWAEYVKELVQQGGSS